MKFIFPPEYDSIVYKERYPDLSELSLKQLRDHWRIHGRKKGFNASVVNSINDIFECVKSANNFLEIGVWDKPSLEFFRDNKTCGGVIKYADWFSQDYLREKSRKTPGRQAENVPVIDYVLSEGGYAQIKQKFEVIVSNHCVEHQPCLISHFINISEILEDGGVYIFTTPTKNKSFDFFRPETTIADLVTAFYEKRTRPTLQQVIETRCFSRKNYRNSLNPYLDNGGVSRSNIESAVNEYFSSDYNDVHCWVYTMDSFRNLFSSIKNLGLLSAQSTMLTYSLNNQFVCVVKFK